MNYNSENLLNVNVIIFYAISVVSTLKFFLPRLRNLIKNYYDQKILNFNIVQKLNTFRKNISQIFSIKTYGELPDFTNFLEIAYLQIIVEKSLVNDSNELFRHKLKKFLLETQDEDDENIEQLIEENNHFIIKINVAKMLSLYNDILNESVVTNNFTNTSVPTVFMSVDVCLQYYFGLGINDYLLQSIGLNLHYMHLKTDIDVVSTYVTLVTNRNMMNTRNPYTIDPEVVFDLDLFDYQIQDEEYCAVKCLLITYHNNSIGPKFSVETLYGSIFDFYSYLKPIQISELPPWDTNMLPILNKFVSKNITPFFEKIISEYINKY